MTKTEKLLALSNALLWNHVLHRLAGEFVGRDGKLVKEYTACGLKAGALARRLAKDLLGIEIERGMSYVQVLNPIFDQLDGDL